MLLQKGLSMEQQRSSTLEGNCDTLHAAITVSRRNVNLWNQDVNY